MEAFAERQKQEFLTTLNSDMSKLQALRDAEVKDLTNAIQRQIAIEKELLTKIVPIEQSLGVDAEEIQKKQTARNETVTTQNLTAKELDQQNRKLREACKGSEKLLTSLALESEKLQSIKDKLVQYADQLEEKLDQLLQEKDPDTESEIVLDWDKHMEELKINTHSANQCLKHAVRLSTLLTHEKPNLKEIGGVVKKLLEDSTFYTRQSSATEKLFLQSPSLLTLQKKWAILEQRLGSLLTDLDWFHKHRVELDEIVELYKKSCQQCKEEITKLQEAGQAISNYAWRAYSKVCGSTRGKKERLQRIEHIDTQLKVFRTSYGNELQRITNNVQRYSQQSSSYFFETEPPSKRQKGEEGLVLAGRRRGFDHLKSPWSIKFQATEN